MEGNGCWIIGRAGITLFKKNLVTESIGQLIFCLSKVHQEGVYNVESSIEIWTNTEFVSPIVNFQIWTSPDILFSIVNFLFAIVYFKIWTNSDLILLIVNFGIWISPDISFLIINF